MNYTLITDDVIVGSQPQKAEDIDHLKDDQKVGYILNLQQDKDIEYWGINLQSIIERSTKLGIRHMRRPAKDFDPESLSLAYPMPFPCWSGRFQKETAEYMYTVLLVWGGHQLFPFLTCIGSAI